MGLAKLVGKSIYLSGFSKAESYAIYIVGANMPLSLQLSIFFVCNPDDMLIYILVVLPETRWRKLQVIRGFGHLPCYSRIEVGATRRVIELMKEVTYPEVGIAVGILLIHYRASRDTLFLQCVHYIIIVVVYGPLLNEPIELIMVLISTQAVGESFVFGPSRISDSAAETLPLFIIRYGDVYPAINKLNTTCKLTFSVPATIAALDCAMVVAVP